MEKIVIPLDNGYKLIAEQNVHSEFNKEIFIGVETDTGVYHQDLAIIRPTYKFDNENVVFSSDKFEVLVFGKETQEDYTDSFTIKLYEDNENG